MMRIEPITVSHLTEFLRIGRKLDILEFGLGGTSLLNTPLSTFSNTLVMLDEEDRLYCIGGWYSNGLIWLLCTENVEKFPIKFLRATKKWTGVLLQSVPRLYNCVWTKNQLHVKWLKWLGAEFGAKQGDMQYFEITRKE